MTRAIILAAGQGSRLRPHTDDRPKCLVELLGRPLLDYQVETLQRAGVADITVVTGYRGEMIAARGHATIENREHERTNMVASLMCARGLFDGASDLLIAYGDIVYERSIVEALLACPHELSTAIDLDWRRLWSVRQEDPIHDAETLRLNPDSTIRELGERPRGLDEIEAQYMGLVSIKAPLAARVVAAHDAIDPAGLGDGRDRDNMYMTRFLQHLVDTGHALHAVPVRGGWLELDTCEDLALYQRLHAEGRLTELWSHER